MGEVFKPNIEGDSLEAARLLTEVDHLNRFRLPDGSHGPYALDQLLINLTAAVQEAAQPYAVTPTCRDRVGDDYEWMGQTTRQTAESGKSWYKSPQAHLRLDVEVDEAEDARDNLLPGYLKVLISPRMTEEDAPREVAQMECLAEDDAIRTTGLLQKDGEISGMKLDSLLIRDIPLSAWIAMANDPNGMFGGQVVLPQENSALPLMRAHRQMHVPADRLPEGPLTVVAEVIPYIQDPRAKAKVERHLAMFRSVNQQEEYGRAENLALRWRDFEVDLSDSLDGGFATRGILQFIQSVNGSFNGEVRSLIAEQFASGEGRLTMTRELASKLEAARRNTLWVAAAVVSSNEDVLRQLSPQEATSIKANEMLLQHAQENGYSVHQIHVLESQNNRLIADKNVAVGRGCPGEIKNIFESQAKENSEQQDKLESTDDENGSAIGTIRCIKCRRYVQKSEVVKKTCWECPKCQHKVDICSGEVIREGFVTSNEKIQSTLQPLVIEGLAELVSKYSLTPKKHQKTMPNRAKTLTRA